MSAPRDHRATALATVLAAWWVAMAAGNLPWVDPATVRARDRWGSLIPNWKFFTPKPIQHDRYLRVRTIGPDGAKGPWLDAAPVPLRSWRHGVWFPLRRRDRALAIILPRVGDAASRGTITTVAAELHVLDGMAAHVVRRLGLDAGATAYQLSILRVQGEGGKQNQMYLSSLRPLS